MVFINTNSLPEVTKVSIVFLKFLFSIPAVTFEEENVFVAIFILLFRFNCWKTNRIKKYNPHITKWQFLKIFIPNYTSGYFILPWCYLNKTNLLMLMEICIILMLPAENCLFYSGFPLALQYLIPLLVLS